MNQYEFVLSILVFGMFAAGTATTLWVGIAHVREMDTSGWLYIAMGLGGLLFLGYSSLNSQGWTGLMSMVVVPASLSGLAYGAYRAQKKARVWLGAAVAVWIALLVLLIVVVYAVLPGGLPGWAGLAFGALVSYLGMLLIQPYVLEPRSRVEQRRTTAGCLATLGAAFGLTAGGVALRGAMEVLGPDFAAAILACLGGWLGFSIVGATILVVIRETRPK